MKGYLNNAAETAATLRTHADGRVWLHTGDVGTMDNDGFIYFKQRLKRLIIVSGINVYPSQVENTIDAHPDVLLSCAIGIPDPYKMHKVKALVVLRPGVEPSEKIKEEERKQEEEQKKQEKLEKKEKKQANKKTKKNKGGKK